MAVVKVVVEGGPSGRETQFVDIKLKVPPLHQFLIALISMSTKVIP